MASIEVLSVGTELLLGQLVDTNSAHVASALAEIGVDVYAKHTVGDNRARIADAIRQALERADGVVTTGGLGPTIDDLTKEAVCDAFGVPAELDEPSLRAMRERFAQFGREMPENNVKQAMLPRGALVLENPHGTAPGFIAFRSDGKFAACMPGVPREMKPMLAERVVPWLRSRFDLQQAIYTRVLHTIAIGESDVDRRIDDLFRTLENPKIAVLAHDFRCDVKIMAKASSAQDALAMIEPVELQIRERLAGHVFGTDAQTLPGAIHELLRGCGQTVAVAESCTGGRVCALLTETPGSSSTFVGGVVAYDNAVKLQALGVARETLEKWGAVSEQTAIAMAAGVRERLGSSIGLSTTGIAGPDGGTPDKPVGLVYLGIASPEGARGVRTTFPGDR
ncbi:MAG TPA: competence/damage-inducible protein A, partial [Candidatus Baltobacteraceae bacterium]|nr:competence/damage-inducible protein A [Candidatus Baltobacteraceae bacterium]